MSDKIDKLPKWAQERIRDLERERDTAIRALNQFRDSQTKSRIWISELVCTGETPGPSEKIQYLQTNHVYFRHDNCRFEITLPYDPDHEPDKWPQIRALDDTLMLRAHASNVIDFNSRRD